MHQTHRVLEGEHEWLASIAADILNLDHREVRIEPRPALDIQSNALFEATEGGRRIVLKVFLKPEEFGEAPLREYKALQLLSELDVAPQPVAFYSHNSQQLPVVVYDYMEGQMWDRYIPNHGELLQLASLWSTVNDITDQKLWLSRGQERTLDQVWRDIGRYLRCLG